MLNNQLIEVKNLTKSYGNSENVFENVNFNIAKNEFICLIGHSGCGKSTILNALAGLENATSGQIMMHDKLVTAPGLDRGVVFQSHALLPWLSVADNIGFALKAKNPSIGNQELYQKIDHYLNLVGLLKVKDKKPSALSGGMKQRVGIARAFSTEPKLLLMDEPFGALDALTRGVIQDELVNIVADTHQTVFMITHDIDEAILLADRIFLMSNGPRAFLAEIVENTIPKPRHRDNIHHNSQYYTIRNHLLDFLVHRSRALQAQKQRPNQPAVINFNQADWSGL
ncbi:nitrate ABC transporter ATPases C and D [Moraxella macacae 0408225]|uniref:Nitrate ABC transporter ATPases C and D n=1 Tax=Moraxella macacae 0408225 TaxID=1230338 RepID=L2F846_9GAMM|nr:ABC transporter ATP-binding protein [Moraxella macacae]ELA08628.1 nitrate ABC transporter ATPases C and D [Moraxella macacae 0408225]